MADFGAQLREARERKGISLRQIATSTKISVAALEGLERNDISKLPGGIFSRAFVRSYAMEVGLDPEETVRLFLQRFEAEPSAPSSQSQAAAPSDASSAPGRSSRASRSTPGAAEGGTVTAEADFESRQRMAGVVLKLALVSVPIAAAIVYFGSRASTVTTRSGGGARPEASDSARAGIAQETPGAPPPTIRQAELEQASAVTREHHGAVAATPSTAAPAVKAPEQQGRAVRLEIAPTSACWVRLTVDGMLALSRVIEPGEREAREFRESAVLQVGDAAACVVSFNGQAARPLGRQRQVREVRVTPDNYRRLLP